MKLYHFDHCPYCVRARMIFGLHNLPFEETILLNDDEVTPISLIGKKQVPILHKPDNTYMGESLDIVHFVDEYVGRSRLDETIRPEIQTWYDTVKSYDNHLVMPRDIQLGLPEFATQSAIDYFVAKKEAYIGSFQDNLNNTAMYVERLHQDLAQLEEHLLSEEWANGTAASIEDILLFPMLRNLTMVREVVFPPKVVAYIRNMAIRCGVDLYFDRAL